MADTSDLLLIGGALVGGVALIGSLGDDSGSQAGENVTQRIIEPVKVIERTVQQTSQAAADAASGNGGGGSSSGGGGGGAPITLNPDRDDPGAIGEIDVPNVIGGGANVDVSPDLGGGGGGIDVGGTAGGGPTIL